MQGREKDAIVISLVRSNEKVSRHPKYHITQLTGSPERSRIFEGEEAAERLGPC